MKRRIVIVSSILFLIVVLVACKKKTSSKNTSETKNTSKNTAQVITESKATEANSSTTQKQNSSNTGAISSTSTTKTTTKNTSSTSTTKSTTKSTEKYTTEKEPRAYDYAEYSPTDGPGVMTVESGDEIDLIDYLDYDDDLFYIYYKVNGKANAYISSGEIRLYNYNDDGNEVIIEALDDVEIIDVEYESGNDTGLKLTNDGEVASIKTIVNKTTGNVKLYSIAITYNVKREGLFSNTYSFSVPYETTIDDALKNIELTFKKDSVSRSISLDSCGIDSSDYDGTVDGYHMVYISYEEYIISIAINVNVPPRDAFKDENATKLKDLTSLDDVTIGLPHEGNVNVLVLPIKFTDKTYTNYKTILEKAFNGTEEDTGWESLKSYYNKVSYGKLNINATILDAYETNETFDKDALYEDALDYDYFLNGIEANDSMINYKDYDQNNDGYIDCVYIVYLAPYNAEDSESLWWAYTDEYIEEGEETLFDGVGLDFYMFFSYEFFFDPIIYGEEEDGSEDVYIDINCETIIHETGHALGLDDYYDYDEYEGPCGGAGGSIMMDYNVGDHDAYSKAILGWVSPTIVQGKDYTTTLRSFESTGDCVIIAKNWDGSYFTEYYIIDFYTPTGVNELCKGDRGLFTIPGVRIYHIDATAYEEIYTVFEATIYNNTSTEHKLISLVECDGENNIEEDFYPYGAYSEDSDLFLKGDSLTPKWYDETDCGFTIRVEDITSDGATIIIDYK